MTVSPVRIGVIGTGAIGGFYGLMLARVQLYFERERKAAFVPQNPIRQVAAPAPKAPAKKATRVAKR